MKKIVLLLTFMLAAAVCGRVYAQQNVSEVSYSQAKNTSQQTKSFAEVEVKPKFQNGEASNFTRWVFTELKYPEQAVAENLSGRVAMQFTIAKDGSVTNVRVLRSAHPALDAEAVRVISMSPKWEPGKVKGKPVDVIFTFPVIFKMRNASVATFDLDVTPAVFESPYKKEGVEYSTSTEFTKWVFMNIKYPAEARANGIQGNAKVAFDILNSGEIANVRIVESAHPLLDEELVRVIKLSPKWKAAIRKGQPVTTTYTFPFRFVLR